MTDDVLDCITINHSVCGSRPAWRVIPLPKALVHWSLWKHFRWGNISPVSFCMICDSYLWYHNIPAVTSVCACVCVWKVSGMGLHLLHLTPRLLHNALRKKTTCHCLIYGLLCVTLDHLGCTAVLLPRKEKYSSCPLFTLQLSVSFNFYCEL